MTSYPRGTDWRSILLLIFSLGVIVLAVSAAIGTLLLLALDESILPEFQRNDVSPLATILTASGLVVVGALLIPGAWLSLQRLRGRETRLFSLPPLRPWGWILIPSLWALSMVTATIFHNVRGAGWFVPLLHVLSIGLPIYVVIHIAVNGISLGSSQRAWGVFGIGMTLSPFLAVIAEFIIILFVVVIVGIYLGLNPEKALDIQRIASQIENAPDLESVLALVGPLINHPLVLIGALTFLSFLVPIFEEAFKSAGVWLVADRLASPAQGFALGILSGAGFAIAESLFASITPDDTWALTLSMRAISGSMHMLASGLIGWGIAHACLEKRYLRLAGMTLLAMSLHGAWNAGAVLTVAGGLRVMLTMPDFDILGTLLVLGGAGLLFMLMTGMFVALFVINGKLRITSTPTRPTATLFLSLSTGEKGRGKGGGR
jgi:hypothetical protein